MPGSIVLDVLLILLLLSYAAYGIRAGFALSLGSMLGFVAGAIGSFFAIPLVADWVSTSAWRLPAVLLVVVVLLVVGQSVGASIGRGIRSRVEKSPLKGPDRVLGGVITLVISAVTVSTLAFGVGSLGVPVISEAIGASRVVAIIDRLTPDPVKALEASVRSLVATDGLPRLLDAGQLTAVAVPPDGTNTAAQLAAGHSVVKIVGTAFLCGQTQSGSGFVVSPGRVVTNAHVVAGVSQPVVETPDGAVLAGRVVYFDGAADLAVIAVNGLTTPPLVVGPELMAGQTAVFDGYPLGGPFRSGPAAVESVATVNVPNIYGDSASPREVYYLAANVQAGNSGGPLLDAAGEVAGVVFAKSATTANLGFAMTTDDLVPVVSAAPRLDSAVASGHCSTG